MPTIKLTARAELQASTEGHPRRFRVDPAYSGGTVPGYTASMDAPLVIDLATLSTRNERVVANLDHKHDARVGHVDEITNDGRTLKLAGVVSAATGAAEEFLSSAQKGFPWSASIEAELPTLEFVAKGKPVSLNSQSFTGPLYVARGARLTAIAFVSTGADPHARAFAASHKKGRFMNQCTFQEFVNEVLPDFSEWGNVVKVAQLHATYEGRNKLKDSDFEAVSPLVIAAGGAVDETTVRLLRAEADAEREKQLAEIRDSRLPLAHTVRAGRREHDGQLVVAALCIQGGLSNIEKQFPEQVLDAAYRASRSIGLQAMLMQAACANGYHAYQGEHCTQGNLRQILQAAFQPDMRAMGWSTLSIPNVLSNTANKFLLDGFTEIEQDWRSISKLVPVSNFKEHTFVRLLDALEYDEVGAGGEIKHGTLADATMTARANTYGKMLSITRQSIINDDLSALADVPRRLGRAAAMKFTRLFWAAFLATADNFFHANNGNVKTGSGTALTTTGTALEAALTAFRAQRTPATDGAKRISGKPAVLMVPGSLGITARRLLNSSTIVSTDAAMTPAGNPYQGLAQLVEVDWLEDSDFTGYSAAKWYLFRSAAIAPAMLVAALNGRVEPTVETAEADFATLGIQMRGFSDVGVSRGETLCGIQVAGTA